MKQPFSSSNKSGLTRDLISALFPMFEQASAGAIVVDLETRITWINASYATLLGVQEPAAVIGKPVRQVIPQTRMPEVVETGRPLLLDIMEHDSQQLVVTRLPFFDDAGKVVAHAGASAARRRLNPPPSCRADLRRRAAAKFSRHSAIQNRLSRI